MRALAKTGPQKSQFWGFLQLASKPSALEPHRDSVHGGVVGLKSYLTVVETRDAANISMFRLNIGSGKLSSCILSIGLRPKCEQGKGGQLPLALNIFGSSANAEHA